MIRFYFNVTNKCNTRCGFCCMWSSPSKSTFLSLPLFEEILNSKRDNFELQLEGGEPFLHPEFYDFLEIAKNTKRCSKITISTNGLVLQHHIENMACFSANDKIPLIIKPSLNYHLISVRENIFKYYQEILKKYKDRIEIKFNVRLRKNDEWLLEALEEHDLLSSSNVFELQSYGRYSNRKTYKKPFIVQNIEE